MPVMYNNILDQLLLSFDVSPIEKNITIMKTPDHLILLHLYFYILDIHFHGKGNCS